MADARSAVIDELDFGYEINPGAGLDEVFGVRRDDWIGERRGSYAVRLEGDSWADMDGKVFNGKFFRESWELQGGVEVLARFSDTQEPAFSRNQYGKGSAVLAAVPLGGSYFHDESNLANEVIVRLAKQAGVISPVAWKGNGGADAVRDGS
ncbi:hypothetical protein VDG1235_139 [Verrucomicrobiia bacterium DG1235]|nr:hypothetical protein VDG1235_139 [Verrucomicrobiae bacterium DG1235]